MMDIVLFPDHHESTPSYQPDIPKIFAEMSTTHLTQISLGIIIEKDNDINNVDWRRLGHLLRQPQFKSLWRLHIEISRAYSSMPNIAACRSRIFQDLGIPEMPDNDDYRNFTCFIDEGDVMSESNLDI
jgi:hypothetical protein